MRGQTPVLQGELFDSVKAEDCYWNISDGRLIEITLQKVHIHVCICVTIQQGVCFWLTHVASNMLHHNAMLEVLRATY